jgi:hypothetical protein
MFLRIQFGGILFKKGRFQKLLFGPINTNPFGGTLEPHGASLRFKNYQKQNVLEFKGLFYAKEPRMQTF